MKAKSSKAAVIILVVGGVAAILGATVHNIGGLALVLGALPLIVYGFAALVISALLHRFYKRFNDTLFCRIIWAVLAGSIALIFVWPYLGF